MCSCKNKCSPAGVLAPALRDPNSIRPSLSKVDPEITNEIVQAIMDRFYKLTGRGYRIFDYCGAPDAEQVVIIMCSGAETVEETVRCLVEKGEKVTVTKHGRPIVDIIPSHKKKSWIPAWKKPGLKLDMKGDSLSQAIIDERDES